MTCKLSTAPLSPTLSVHLFLASHPISSPLADEVGTQDIVEADGADGIDFHTVAYHLEAASVHLPPLLLIEPCDDQNRAETDYDLHQGYRYIGQVLLPDFQRGERVDVIITREALALWEQWLPLSVPHQQARALDKHVQEDLFRLDPSTLPFKEDIVSRHDALLLQEATRLLQETSEHQRRAGLEVCQQLAASALPLAQLLPCLNDPRSLVREAAFVLLQRAVDRLSMDQLYQISSEAAFPARLAAITLLGRKGGEEAVANLNCIGICGPLRREHALERITILNALTQACTSFSPRDLAYQDIVASLRHVAETDPLSEVRDAAVRCITSLDEKPPRQGIPGCDDPFLKRFSPSVETGEKDG